MVVVKAFSYGSGSFEIANVLQFHNVDYLAVAYVDEGIELRKAGIKIPIMVMNPANGSFEAMLKYDLEPEIYSFKILEELTTFIEINQMESPFPIHIKIDSGMHRLGFEKENIDELIQRIQTNPALDVKSIFSHLSGSDESEMDDFSKSQIKLFEKISDQFIAQLDKPIIRHILNTNGIVRFPDHHNDMVRLGMGLYGISSDPTTQKNLQPTSSLKSSISQLKKVKSNETVGYGRKGTLTKDTVVATIPIGYADGAAQKLRNG